MIILGLNFGHDGSAAIIKHGQLLASIASERITRIKKQRGVPPAVLAYLFEAAHLKWDDIDLVTICNWRGDIHNGASLYNRDADGWMGFLQTAKGQLPATNSNYMQYSSPSEGLMGSICSRGSSLKPAWFAAHHLSHTSYAYFMSPFSDATSISIDVGDEFDNTSAIVDFKRGGLYYRILKNDGFFWPSSFYSQVCDTLGFYPSLIGAGKVMALAAYLPPSKNTDMFGWQHGIPPFFDPLSAAFRMQNCDIPAYRCFYPQLQNEGGVVGEEWRNASNWDTHDTLQISANAQDILEKSIIRYVSMIVQLTRAKNICLSGGTMLNCVANGKLKEQLPDVSFFIAPACGDDGLAIGSAMIAHSMWQKNEFGLVRKPTAKYQCDINDIIEGGRSYQTEEIRLAMEEHRSLFEEQDVHVSDATDELPDFIAGLLNEGKIVAWFEGGSEIGPRALGHRSILADARNPAMKDILNAKVKHRESFRPFCPVVLKEHAKNWFVDGSESPFMLFSTECRKKELIPSAVHVDGTSRIQTIDATNNGRYHSVVNAFYNLTGVPMLINTSFNVQGEPIVETPLDAIKCFLGTAIDCMVLEDFVLIKTNKQTHQI